jgi:hypothetical protein
MNPIKGTAGNVVTMASPSPTDTSTKMSDGKKQERLELLTYIKAHLDLVAVTLLVAYLSYNVYKMNESIK